MTNTIEFVTTSGVKAVIKERLTFGEKRRIQRVMMAGIKVESENESELLKEMNASMMIDYQDGLAQAALVSIEVDGAIISEKPYEAMLLWEGDREKDAQEIINKISQIHIKTENKEEGEKKETTTV